ncbi:unnamed protein product [Ilex paraguariensis]|uniref:Uncharacterized protein n=1 Tax=Ilex paraguariensis TaxID=185542 RepID=A0ABC8UVP4_9AQUA
MLVLSSTSSLANALTRGEIISARSGVIATDTTRCSKIGENVLREGGHAVDASVAAALCLGVVSPASSGIGGGGFMLVKVSSGEVKVFDMRETAPKQASQNMYAGNHSQMSTGALSIAVPGQLAGLYAAWKQYGKLPWKRLVKLAENLARRGFKVSSYLYKQMISAESRIKADKGLCEIYAPRGSLLLPGHVIRNINLANTLSEISKYGVAAFYNGSIGNSLVTDIRKAGGILTMEDLQSYQVKFREPIVANVQGFKIFTVPPPASGGAEVILMLKILAQYGRRSGVSGSLGIHRVIEALKYALATRMGLGDPDFVDARKVLSSMLSSSFAARLKNTIDDNRTYDSDHYGGKWDQLHDHGTTHLCIVDRERNVVSMTASINSYFGSKFLSPSTGIVLNNQMDDFSIPTTTVSRPAPANFIRPSKRPLSSMAPTIILKVI